MPFWGLNFVEFWCWGLIFGGQGGPPPPGSAPASIRQYQEIRLDDAATTVDKRHKTTKTKQAKKVPTGFTDDTGRLGTVLVIH